MRSGKPCAEVASPDVGVIFVCVVEVSAADIFVVGVSSVPVVGVTFRKLLGTLAVDEETVSVSVVFVPGVVVGELLPAVVSVANVFAAVAVLVSASVVVFVCGSGVVSCKVNEVIPAVAMDNLASILVTAAITSNENIEAFKVVVNFLDLPSILDAFVREEIVALGRSANVNVYDGDGVQTVTVDVSIDVVVIVLVVVSVLVTELLDDAILGAIDDVVEAAVVEAGLGLGSGSGLGLGFGSVFGVGGAVHLLNNFKFFFVTQPIFRSHELYAALPSPISTRSTTDKKFWRLAPVLSNSNKGLYTTFCHNRIGSQGAQFTLMCLLHRHQHG